MKLVVFDLDQTLVDLIPFHDQAFDELFKRFFGKRARLTEIDFAGKGLVDNFVELAKLKGIAEDRVRPQTGTLVKAYEAIFSALAPGDASRYLLPGAVALLEELSRSDNLSVLYTGSSRGVVEAVFRATGLGKYFKLAFFATEAPTRADMVRLAIERAKELTGKGFKGKDVVVIGDSVRDIETGKQFGALTIAVATGFHTIEELAKRHPDSLFLDLSDYRAVLKAIEGTVPMGRPDAEAGTGLAKGETH